MNQLEGSILDSVKKAHLDYEHMTGCWLSHGPESFLMCALANRVAIKGDYWVFVDASPRKIKEERAVPPARGRPPKNQRQRFDMVVWAKASNDIKAIIEIKRAWNVAGLRADRRKIADFIEKNPYVKAGYLVAYTEAKGTRRAEAISKRFAYWAESLDSKFIGSTIDVKGDGDWCWGFGLFRLDL